ncbi:DUF1934 domain-containing protein [Paenibacillus sp. BC26]|uniref:DUF1934 domain-containing protein n=1 Tax=Paenibacillus sp. BC26 TaxID=1881032 RepID=UPI0008E1D99E|nr:DUF1934 domain-containing protein [Paenibacillus sp. BC26]SFT26455.1 Uncharacterized beta-barrel protein YwiB, DUF1934 family [Paenibacillus sp. BC26]
MTDRANVTISLRSDIDGEVEQNTFNGEWFRKGSSVFVRYEEASEGEGDSVVRTIIRYRDGELSVTRRGDVESLQTFVAGTKRTGHYESAHAAFHLETETKLLWVQFGDLTKTGPSDGQLKPDLPMLIEWHYTLLVNDEPTGEFRLRLQAEELLLT